MKIAQENTFQRLLNGIPEIFSSKLRAHPSLFSVSDRATNILSNTLYHNSPLPFFPEYTDHSLSHVFDTFKTAISLIHQDGMAVLTADDVNTLYLSCLAHDIGMTITEEMFERLIEVDSSPEISDYDNSSWRELWNEFLAEARRFNERTLLRLIGKPDPIRWINTDPMAITKTDRLLIGEFIRRNHARLAHEFCRNDFDALTEKPLNAFSDLDKKERDIIGLIARSHGYSLRENFSYIKTNFHLREYRNIHIIYVSILLRIADRFQIHPNRAPLSLGKITKIYSQTSSAEWRLHESAENIVSTHDDPEALEIQANPTSPADYERLVDWLNSLQEELDRAWAILGELYGRVDPLSCLALKVRRVRSDLEDPCEFSRKAHFIVPPSKISIAESEVLQLFVAPLYGNNPLYGLRELIQNSVDSTIELRELFHDQDLSGADVEVELSDENNRKRLTVQDRGTGMTLNVINNYFLKAGASFRYSDTWRRAYTDEEGHSKIPRSGRFGIGVLAGFLLGNNLSVSTRHYGEEVGKSFLCSLKNEQIAIYENTCVAGTKIEIDLSDDAFKVLKKYFQAVVYSKGKGFFYQKAYPSLRLCLDIEDKSEYIRIPGFVPCLPKGMDSYDNSGDWNVVETDEFQHLSWKYVANEYGLPRIFVNGIAVCPFVTDDERTSAYSPGRFYEYTRELPKLHKTLNMPTIAIEDYDGHRKTLKDIL